MSRHARVSQKSPDEFLSKVATTTANVTDSRWYEYDLRRRLSHVNVTEFDF